MSSPSGVHPPLPPQLDPRGRRRAAPRQPRTGRRPPTRISRIARRLLVVVAAVAAVAVLVGSASGYALLTWSSRSIERVDAFAGLTDRPPANAAGSTTFLLVGSDGRTGMSSADMKRLHVGNAATAAGRRADTMLLVHVSARHGTVDVGQPPARLLRDDPRARVGGRRPGARSAATSSTPPTRSAARRSRSRPIERSTGVRIDHYLEVDFLGFVRPGRRRRRGRRVQPDPAARPQGRPAAARRGQPRRRRDRPRLRPGPPPRRPGRPRPGRAPAAVPRRDGRPGHQPGRPARPAGAGALPGRRAGRGPRRPGPHRGRAGRGWAPGSGTCPAATSGSAPCRSPTRRTGPRGAGVGRPVGRSGGRRRVHRHARGHGAPAPRRRADRRGPARPSCRPRSGCRSTTAAAPPGLGSRATADLAAAASSPPGRRRTGAAPAWPPRRSASTPATPRASRRWPPRCRAPGSWRSPGWAAPCRSSSGRRTTAPEAVRVSAPAAADTGVRTAGDHVCS